MYFIVNYIYLFFWQFQSMSANDKAHLYVLLKYQILFDKLPLLEIKIELKQSCRAMAETWGQICACFFPHHIVLLTCQLNNLWL